MGAVNGMRPNGQVRLSMLLEHNDLVVTVVTIPIATNVYNAANQSEVRRNCNPCQARENVTIFGFAFAPDWLKRWHVC